MGHRSRGSDLLEFECDRVGFEDTDPDRELIVIARVAEHDDRHVRDRIDHQPLDPHLDLHRRRLPAAFELHEIRATHPRATIRAHPE